MHPNGKLLEKLYSALDRHDDKAMVECYHDGATFHDIAFDLAGKEEIGAMWAMICSGDIRATFQVVRADDREGVARIVDQYTFTDTGRKVRNEIESRFDFRDGLIARHSDSCDPRAWAAAAIGGVGGFIAGRVHFLRAWKARRKLRRYTDSTTPDANQSARAQPLTQGGRTK